MGRGPYVFHEKKLLVLRKFSPSQTVAPIIHHYLRDRTQAHRVKQTGNKLWVTLVNLLTTHSQGLTLSPDGRISLVFMFPLSLHIARYSGAHIVLLKRRWNQWATRNSLLGFVLCIIPIEASFPPGLVSTSIPIANFSRYVRKTWFWIYSPGHLITSKYFEKFLPSTYAPLDAEYPGPHQSSYHFSQRPISPDPPVSPEEFSHWLTTHAWHLTTFGRITKRFWKAKSWNMKSDDAVVKQRLPKRDCIFEEEDPSREFFWRLYVVEKRSLGMLISYSVFFSWSHHSTFFCVVVPMEPQRRSSDCFRSAWPLDRLTCNIWGMHHLELTKIWRTI